MTTTEIRPIPIVTGHRKRISDGNWLAEVNEVL